MPIEKKPFGKTPDGRAVWLYTITNRSGASVSISDFGGTLVSIRVPDKNGVLTDVLLGYPSIEGYFPNKGYLGALIGRVGNRICRGQCPLNGHTLYLNTNSGGHHLHGGNEGFDRKIWNVSCTCESSHLTLEYVSKNGEEFYPGTLQVTVTYAFSEDNALSIRYSAVSDKDTLCNLTNHAYFNLSGEGSGTVLDHQVCILADQYTEVDKECIPTGNLVDVKGTSFDLTQGVRLGDRIGNPAHPQVEDGIDHNYCLNGAGLRQVAWVYSPATGIRMTVDTDQPGVQLYTSNTLEGVNPAKCGRVYGKWEGMCLETQVYPDAVNHENFPSCLLKAGQRYETSTIYRFSL